MTVSERRKPGRPKDEAQIARREQEILEQATAFFADRGYIGADLQELAFQLGVGKGTIYRYFPSKEALFLATVDAGMHRLHASIEASSSHIEDPLAKLCAAVRAFLAFFDANPYLTELLIQERAAFRNRLEPTFIKHRKANIGPWQTLLKRMIEEGKIRSMPVERITDTLSTALYGRLFTHHFSGASKSLEDQADDLLDVFLLGIKK